MASSAAEFSGPARQATKVSRDADGNRVEEADGEIGGIRTHDFADEDEVNQKLFGPGATSARTQKTSTRRNADGDIVEESNVSNMRVRTHDFANEDEINLKLFGPGVGKQPAPVARTHTYKDGEGNIVVEAADDADTGIRCHDQSNQDEINSRLFGQGARNAD